MGRSRKEAPVQRFAPAMTPDAKEAQLISLAMACAEKQMREGTASSQVITHYLKLGSSRERLEREKLEEENKLLRAKTKAYESAEEVGKMYEEALNAMRTYSGKESIDEVQDDENV